MLEILRWKKIFFFLSLERMDRFLPDVGLSLSISHEVRGVIRYFITELDQTGLYDPANIEYLFSQAIAKIQLLEGPEYVHKLLQWGNDVLPLSSPGNNNRYGVLNIWEGLFRLFDREAKKNIDLIDLSRDKLDQIQMIIKEELTVSSELNAKIKVAGNAPRSEWDDYLYKLGEETYFDPFSLLKNAIYLCKTEAAWEQIKKILTEEDRQILLSWAEENVSNVRPSEVRETPVKLLP